MSDNAGDGILVRATLGLIDQYVSDTDEPLPIDPQGLYAAMSGSIKKMVERGEQCDADEFFDLYIEALGRQLRAQMDRVDRLAATTFRSTWVFRGEQSIVRRQDGESSESRTFQPFHSLRVGIENESITSIEDALRHWNAPSPVKNALAGVTEQTYLETLPEILAVTLVRFHPDDWPKHTKFIAYQTTLVLPPEVLTQKTDYPVTYDLFAVIHHHGPNLQYGHHSIDVLHSANGWVHIDDESVQGINEEEALRSHSDRSAYILFYQRVRIYTLGN